MLNSNSPSSLRELARAVERSEPERRRCIGISKARRSGRALDTHTYWQEEKSLRGSKEKVASVFVDASWIEAE